MAGATRGIRRVLVVAVVAVGAFVVSIVALADDARLGCVLDARPDPAYQAQLLGQPEVTRTDYEIAVTRDGRPVAGARVCATAAMVGMSGMGLTVVADEPRRGVYRVELVLEMSGEWQGDIVITELGQAPASVPLRFTVT